MVCVANVDPPVKHQFVATVEAGMQVPAGTVTFRRAAYRGGLADPQTVPEH
jgi:hypothetical protein